MITANQRRAAEKRTGVSTDPVCHETEGEGEPGRCHPVTTIIAPWYA